MSEPSPQSNRLHFPDSEVRSLHGNTEWAVRWFLQRVRLYLGENLKSQTVFGPVVTPIYEPRQHQIHHLIVMGDRNVDQLLALAKESRASTARNIAPPLIITESAILQSCDVFPLEWLDIAQFHYSVFGDPGLSKYTLQPSLVRLQCERELRSLDLLLQRGLLASGGRVRKIGRLERSVSDTLIRVIRGIGWLAGDRKGQLPLELCARCVEIVGFDLQGCREAIRADGRHDLETLRLLLKEIGELSEWVNHLKVVNS